MFAVFGKLEMDVMQYVQSFESAEGIEYAEIPLIGQKPSLQKVGIKLDTIKITVKLHQNFGNPKESIDKIRKMKNDAKAYPFVFGNGVFDKEYVICDMQIVSEKMQADGTLVSALVTLDLKESNEDSELTYRVDGEGLESNSVFVTNDPSPDP